MTPATRRSTAPARRPAARKPGSDRSFLWRWRRALFLGGLLFMAAIGGLAFVLVQIELPPEQIQAETTFVCAADVQQGCNASNSLATLHAEQDRVNVRLDQVPQVMVDAVLAAEDKDFFKHGGVDPFGVARALWADVRSRDARQGGSTITQQYVKNVYLTSERTLTRKLKEAVLAVKLEQEYSKQEILERYLNTIYFGRGAYGVGAAARAYFGHDVGALTLPESAYLAGLIRAPEVADATRDAEAAAGRRTSVLEAMVDGGFIDRSQLEAAELEPWTVIARSGGETKGTEVKGTEYGTAYFVEYVRRQLLANGFTDAQIYGGGLRVYTTIDLDAQRAAWDAIASTLDRDGDPLAALVAIDGNGLVRAMIGGRDYSVSEVNLAVGKDGGGTGRQPGSAMKPFVLAAAVKQGISLQSHFSAPGSITIPKANAGKDWKVRNYGGTEQGVLSLVDATRVSSNTVYAQLMKEVGPESVVPLAKEMGVTAPLDPVMSLVLGTEEVSALDLASAYSTFASDGVHIAPLVITRVERADGSVVKTFPQPRKQVFSIAENNQITYALRQVVDGGTGTSAKFGKTAAGKTGTTQENRDAWFVGFLPNGYTAAVWMGFDPPREMDDVHGRAVTGGSFPAAIWKAFMQRWSKGVDAGRFTTPGSFPGKVLNRSLTPPSTVPDESSTSIPIDTTPITEPDGSSTSTTGGGSTTSTQPGSSTTMPPTTPTTEDATDAGGGGGGGPDP